MQDRRSDKERFVDYTTEELLSLTRRELPSDIERADMQELIQQLARRLSMYVSSEVRKRSGWT